jgi:hypothetical protein
LFSFLECHLWTSFSLILFWICSIKCHHHNPCYSCSIKNHYHHPTPLSYKIHSWGNLIEWFNFYYYDIESGEFIICVIIMYHLELTPESDKVISQLLPGRSLNNKFHQVPSSVSPNFYNFKKNVITEGYTITANNILVRRY